MKAFQYVTASNTERALQLCGKKDKFLAGGTDLLGEIKDYVSQPGRLVNIKKLPGTREIVETEDGWKLGANVTIAEIASHAGLQKNLPGVAEAAALVGSPQIRNMGTLAGNLAQHSRCWYYRHRDVQCLKNGGARCYAREAENKYHSLFSGNPCISPVVSNLAVILATLNASVNVQRGKKILNLKMGEFYMNAWFNPYAHHSLQSADLILHIEIPVRARPCVYMQVSEKTDFDWALVSCAAAGELKGNTLQNVRVALGAISPLVHEVEEANEFLENKEIDRRTANMAAEIILREAVPMEHNGYKVPMARAIIHRTLLKLAGKNFDEKIS